LRALEAAGAAKVVAVAAERPRSDGVLVRDVGLVRDFLPTTAAVLHAKRALGDGARRGLPRSSTENLRRRDTEQNRCGRNAEDHQRPRPDVEHWVDDRGARGGGT